MFHRLLIATAGMFLLPGLVFAADELTAEELYIKAINDYNKADYEAALAGFELFKLNFGSLEQGQEAMKVIRYPLAMSYLHQQKFPEALAAIDECLTGDPPPTADQKADLVFYRGVCLMQGDDLPGAREAFASYVREFPTANKVEEALLLVGTTHLLQGENLEAAEVFAGIKDRLSPVNRGRASVLQLFGLIEAGENDAALALVVEEFPEMGNMIQIATFQTLALQLGAAFLENAEYRKAIMCLQRVWEQDRLLKHQEKRLADMQDALAAAEAQPRSDPYTKFQLKQLIAKVDRELENFAAIESFDAALRLRLATAYLAMERYREAALILEAMLEEMPPDPIVESASVSLVQSWSAVEQWNRVQAAADGFVEKFPDSDQLPLVLYLAGIAAQRENDQEAAIARFETILEDHKKSEFVPRALFMKGFSQLLAEQNPGAIETFESFLDEHDDHELADPAAYWRGMAYSLDEQYEKTRDVMDEYLAGFPEGGSRGLAVFRKAYAAHSMMDFATSIPELMDYLNEFRGHESNSEALILLGDAYMNEGNMEYGIAAFRRIPPEDTRFFEEGWFKVGRAYRLMEEPEKMREHFEEFKETTPRSPRVAEAIYQIGWTYRQEGDDEKARGVYWDAIGELGNDPTIRSVEDLFPALAKLYKGDEQQAQYLARLRDLREEAEGDGQETLAMRAMWAQAHALRRSDPEKANEILARAAELVDVPDTNPLILADLAEAFTAAGDTGAAEQMWKDLVKWNPRAPQKDRALAALGNLELARGNERAALEFFDRFERETNGSILYGSVILAKSRLQAERGQFAEARESLEKLLGNEFVGGREKAEALFLMGDLFMREGKPELAVPYFQRIYIMYGRWHEWVAKAYYRSGEAFEELKDTDAARKTYDEMTKREEIQELPEVQQAKDRLKALGGPLES